MAWGWVNFQQIYIFVWTFPLIYFKILFIPVMTKLFNRILDLQMFYQKTGVF